MKIPTYQDYVDNDRHMEQYSSYQDRYKSAPRESDKRMIQLISELAGPGGAGNLLDIGCSTGNFLRHLAASIPSLRLCGGDAAQSVISECQKDESLSKMTFECLDIVKSTASESFDLITMNAVLWSFDEANFSSAVRNIAGSLKPGGHFLCFEPFHPFPQELTIVETTAEHPNGLYLNYRSYGKVEEMLTKHGLQVVEFRPFYMPFALELASPEQTDTYTLETTDGRHLSFRGGLYQPWCHLIAKSVE